MVTPVSSTTVSDSQTSEGIGKPTDYIGAGLCDGVQRIGVLRRRLDIMFRYNYICARRPRRGLQRPKPHA